MPDDVAALRLVVPRLPAVVDQVPTDGPDEDRTFFDTAVDRLAGEGIGQDEWRLIGQRPCSSWWRSAAIAILATSNRAWRSAYCTHVLSKA